MRMEIPKCEAVETEDGTVFCFDCLTTEEFRSDFKSLPEKSRQRFLAAGFSFRKIKDSIYLRYRSDSEIFEIPDLTVPTDEVALKYDANFDKFFWQPKQIAHHISVLSNRKVTVDASETGVGKTFVSLSVAREMGLTPFVICPVSVKHQWRDAMDSLGMQSYGEISWESCKLGKSEFGEFEYKEKKSEEIKRFVDGKKISDRVFKKYQAAGSATFIVLKAGEWDEKSAKAESKRLGFRHVVTFRTGQNKRERTNFFRWRLPEDALVILDEFQKASGENSQAAHMAACLINAPCKVMILTATLAKSPIKMYASGVLLGLHQGRLEWRDFLLRNGCKHIPGRGFVFTKVREHADAILSAISSHIFPKRGIRISKSEIPGFPEEDNQPVALNFGEKETREIEKIYSEMELELRQLSLAESSDGKSELTIRMRARQRTELIKLPLIFDWVSDLLEEGYSVIVFTCFEQTVKCCLERLNCETYINGSLNPKQKKVMQDEFQSNRSRLLICNIASGGAGLNLQDMDGQHPRFSIIFPAEDPIHIVQSMGRAPRPGADEPSLTTSRIVYAVGTVEERVMDKNWEEIQNMYRLSGGMDCKPDFVYA